MKVIINSILLVLLLFSLSVAQGFDVKAKGQQLFTFKNDERNQATFHSVTALDEVDGLTSQISGNISFNVQDVKNSLHGEISFPTSSLQTGIKMRDKDLKEPKWLDAERYPNISFKIKKVLDVKQLAKNKLDVKVLGDFSLHGVTNEIPVEATITYLDESPETEARAPGDLIGISSKFQITLSKYGVRNMILGKRVADVIDIGVNIVGSNKLK